MLDQDEALNFYVSKLGLEVAADVDISRPAPQPLEIPTRAARA